MSSNLNVFISYAREDGREYADRLYRAFNERGISAWRDERNINPYQDFSGEIEKAIEESTHVVACLTPSIAQRKDSFVRREILYAQGWKKPIIPLLMPGFDKGHIPILISHLRWIEFQEFGADFPNLLKELVKDESFVPSAQQDPFQDYLQALYKEVVSFLDSTVFSLITLHSEAMPEAVKPHEGGTLPMGLKGLGFKPEIPQSGRKHFDSFQQAYDYYDGQLLLLGDPGSGKTTTLLAMTRDHVAARLEDPSLPLPILVSISTWDAAKQTPLLDWLSTVVPALKRDEIAQLLESGNVLLLLDGLDELGGEREDPETKERYDPRLRFMKLINDVMKAK